MKDANTISMFVKNTFLKYSLCYSAFFFDYDENDEIVPAPIFEGNIVTPSRLDYLSKLLGMRAEDIANTNFDVAVRIFNKYPFFKLLLDFEERKLLSKFTVDSESLPVFDKRCLYRILENEGLVQKYSDEDLLRRLIVQLKEIDKFIPGTYHPNGEIMYFQHEETTLIEFPECEQMLRSFFDVYMDIGVFRSFVKEFGNPGLQLSFDESTSRGLSFDELRTESILYAYGYSVSESDGLSESARLELLTEIVDLELLTIPYIVNLLEFFIKTHTSDRFYYARNKWAHDMKHISNYNINTQRFMIMKQKRQKDSVI